MPVCRCPVKRSAVASPSVGRNSTQPPTRISATSTIGSNAELGMWLATTAPAAEPANANAISGRNVLGSGRTRR